MSITNTQKFPSVVFTTYWIIVFPFVRSIQAIPKTALTGEFPSIRRFQQAKKKAKKIFPGLGLH